MIQIDPYDSTGYTEFGLALVDNSQYTEGIKYFEKAVQFGPPAVGMNAFFLAQCQMEIKDYKKAISSFSLCIKLDPQAISPLLELYRYYKSNRQKQQCMKIKTKILNNFTLVEQLTNEELNEITNNDF